MESFNACRKAINARLDSGESTEDLNKLVKDEERATYALQTMRALRRCSN